MRRIVSVISVACLVLGCMLLSDLTAMTAVAEEGVSVTEIDVTESLLEAAEREDLSFLTEAEKQEYLEKGYLTTDSNPQENDPGYWKYYEATEEVINQGEEPEMMMFGAPSAHKHRGIDVSSWQQNIDWAKVKASGIDFVFIRCGYRGHATGVIQKDTHFDKNMRGALSQGLEVGVYIASYANNEDRAVAEADAVLEFCQPYLDDITLPYVIDYEYRSGIDPSTLCWTLNEISATKKVSICKAFDNQIKNHTENNSNNRSMVYMNHAMLSESEHDEAILDKLVNNDIPVWYARWNSNDYNNGIYAFHQYSDAGSVNGISGKVDMDYWFCNYSTDSNKITVTAPYLPGTTTMKYTPKPYINGVELPASKYTVTGNRIECTLDGDFAVNPQTVTLYYEDLSNTRYPTGLYVYRIKKVHNRYVTTALSKMEDMLSYQGFQARITGTTGLRYVSGIKQAQKTGLKGPTADYYNYQLMQMGTITKVKSNTTPFNYEHWDNSNIRGGYTYKFDLAKNSISDRYIKSADGRTTFAKVVTGIKPANYRVEFDFRSYAVLRKDYTGKEIVIYGYPKSKSLYDYANTAININHTYTPQNNSAAYNYLNDILVNAPAQ